MQGSVTSAGPNDQQQHGDKTTEARSSEVSSSHVDTGAPDRAHELEQRKEELGRNPGEKAFFKLLHAELKKATHFFERAEQEFSIREERVKEGMEIMKQPNSIMVNEKWSLLAKSIYRLYKDLLLLETFAIMTYCSFSKILKKHDKVTGYSTRTAFMQNVVNKANFTNYPSVLAMIGRCERWYEEVSQRLAREGKQCLLEDERLFINMISRLNQQVLDTEDGEGPPERKENCKRPPAAASASSSALSRRSGSSPGPGQGAPANENVAITTLRSMVEENDERANAAQVSEGVDCTDSVASMDGKRPGVATGAAIGKKARK